MDKALANHIQLCEDNDLQFTAILGALLSLLIEGGQISAEQAEGVFAEANVLPSNRPALIARAVQFRVSMD